uniref:Uncharacterized protein n=1 Tax=Arundo donax TaxID=35708 RepID=A0A0A9BHH5_ARUDO
MSGASWLGSSPKVAS